MKKIVPRLSLFVAVLLVSAICAIAADNPPALFYAATTPKPDDPQFVAKVQQMPFDRAETERLWTTTMLDQFTKDLTEESEGTSVKPEAIASMANKRLKKYRASFTDATFEKELEDTFTDYKQDLVDAANHKRVAMNDRPSDHRPFPADKNTEHKTNLETIAFKWFADRVSANVEASKNERGDIAKGVMVTTGVSVEAINKDGIFGGENSFFRKPFG